MQLESNSNRTENDNEKFHSELNGILFWISSGKSRQNIHFKIVFFLNTLKLNLTPSNSINFYNLLIP